MPDVPRDEPFATQLRRVREARDISRSVLSHRTGSVGDPGISPSGIEALERNPDRRPTDQTILILGEALDPDPGEFPAYDLARARALFSESAAGFDAAWRNLQRLRNIFAV